MFGSPSRLQLRRLSRNLRSRQPSVCVLQRLQVSPAVRWTGRGLRMHHRLGRKRDRGVPIISGQIGRISHPMKTYNASDGVRCGSDVGKPLRRHAQEMAVGLLRSAEICKVHGQTRAQRRCGCVKRSTLSAIAWGISQTSKMLRRQLDHLFTELKIWTSHYNHAHPPKVGHGCTFNPLPRPQRVDQALQ